MTKYPSLEGLEIHIDQSAQCDPYTWVRLRTVFHTRKVFCYGFAECGDKDEFSIELGMKIATGRAMHYLNNIISMMAVVDEQKTTR
jgi:hypothetical protein